ncbi:MAG: hypothetical protein EBR02_05725 [Alphaproteobacteria bacterium]|nr:hypothetical protein [Alphaproteobacteria bacterium]
MHNRINSILKDLRKSPSGQPLDHLESDVWQRIALEKQEAPMGIAEGVLAFLFPMQHRFAPVMCAAVLGVLLGVGTLQTPTNSTDALEMLNFKVFTPQAVSLASLTQTHDGL